MLTGYSDFIGTCCGQMFSSIGSKDEIWSLISSPSLFLMFLCCFLFHFDLKQEGASKEDVEQLSKYKFRKIGDVEKLSGEIQGPSGGIMTECGTDSPIEHVLSPEDAVCCLAFFITYICFLLCSLSLSIS